MTPEDARRMYRAMAVALGAVPNVCECGRWKSLTAACCLGCRTLAQDAQERAEAEQWEPA